MNNFKNLSTLKKILISLVVIIIVAGGVVGGLVLFNKPTLTQVAPEEEREIYPMAPDNTKDFGACKLLDKEKLKTALGTPAATLQGPDNLGLVRSSSDNGTGLLGDQSQVCGYSFITGGKFETSFNIDQGFSVEIYKYATKMSTDAAIATHANDTPVAGLGDSAFYGSTTNEFQGITQYWLTVFSGETHYSYRISEKISDAKYTSETAQAALEAIAKQVTY
ncbi:MAG: hypothetical protein JWM52_661 [Candidatus Saccharibacteria bacterium]|nr:hypothetical protein [Candidatus Saccharibacteria bacterium]